MIAEKGHAPKNRAMNRPINRHCCAVEIGGVGVMIEGEAGAGKTSLALGLVEAARGRGIEAFFIADDQALVERRGGKIIARVPPAIAGLAEVRGHGVVAVRHRPSTQIGLVVRLAEDQAIERMPDPQTCQLLGLTLPVVNTPVRHEAQAVRIVLASLRISLV
jgi:HPr kinase/phosphorylase